MEHYTPLILDAATILIFGLFIYLASRTGFIRSVLKLGGTLASMIVASMLSSSLAKTIYSTFFRTSLINSLGSAIQNSTAPEDLLNNLTQAVMELPAVVVNVLQFDVDSISNKLASSLTDSAETIALTLVDSVVGPAVVSILQVVLFFVLFVLCVIAVKILSQMFKVVDEIPLIGPVNTLLGGVVGAGEAVVLFILAAAVIQAVIVMGNHSMPYLTQDVISSTFVFRLFFEYNPIIDIFGL